MTTSTAPFPQVPAGSPPWATAMLQNIVSWVQHIRRGPQALSPYTTALRPSAAAYPRNVIYDSTLNVPLFSDAAGNWWALVASGAAGTFTTLSITQGAIISGTYLPTLTAVTNVAASTAYNCQYMRVGNVVNVSGKLDVDPTLTGATLLGISLPVASTLSASEKCSGVGASNSVVSEVAAIDGDTINNRAQMDWVTTSLANHTMYFDFQYLVT